MRDLFRSDLTCQFAWENSSCTDLDSKMAPKKFPWPYPNNKIKIAINGPKYLSPSASKQFFLKINFFLTPWYFQNLENQKLQLEKVLFRPGDTDSTEAR